jgi:hypothetical protein
MTKLYSLEEQLVNAFQEAGLEVIGIGNNKKEGLHVGFQRYAFKDSEWTEKVLELMKNARYICTIGYGNKRGGEGFGWETRQIAQHGYLNKTLIFYPADKEDFKAFFETYTELHLKPFFEAVKLKSSEHILGGILYTGSAGNPVYHFRYKSYLAQSKLNVWANTKIFLREELGLPDLTWEPATMKDYLLSVLIDMVLVAVLGIIMIYANFNEEVAIPIIILVLLCGIFRLSPGDRIMRIALRDKSGCPVQSAQNMVFLVTLIFSGCLWFVTYPLLLYMGIVKKRLYVVHCEVSGTGYFRRK